MADTNRNISASFLLLRNRGFTLAELLITISIIGILSTMAIPSFIGSIQSNRLTAYTNDFVTALNLARSEAVKRGVSVAVRKVDDKSSTNLGSSAEWEDGWDIFVDTDADGVFDTGEVLIRTYPALPDSYTLRGNTNYKNFIRFTSMGEALTGRFVLCADRAGNAPKANASKLLMIQTTGRVRIAKDTNSPPDGIPNTSNTASSNITECIFS